MVINLIVTCSNRKTISKYTPILLRSVSSQTIGERASKWINLIESKTSGLVQANDLYTGDHWRIASDLPRIAGTRGNLADLWVCSAGYGLIQSTARIYPYGATFSPRHPDSVVAGYSEPSKAVTVNRSWWTWLSTWQGPEPGSPRTFCQLAQRDPSRPLIVVASADYLKAIASDLVTALGFLNDPDLLVIVSAGTKSINGLDKHLVPCDARFQKMLGGARLSLNVRIARQIIDESPHRLVRATVMRKRYGELLDGQADIEVPHRIPISDQEAKDFIRKCLQDNPGLGHTPILRRLRQTGFACEQSRFRSVYMELKEVHPWRRITVKNF